MSEETRIAELEQQVATEQEAYRRLHSFANEMASFIDNHNALENGPHHPMVHKFDVWKKYV